MHPAAYLVVWDTASTASAARGLVSAQDDQAGK
jgi:hypothetical protein